VWTSGQSRALHAFRGLQRGQHVIKIFVAAHGTSAGIARAAEGVRQLSQSNDFGIIRQPREISGKREPISMLDVCGGGL
jgi:hypothetical protein